MVSRQSRAMANQVGHAVQPAKPNLCASLRRSSSPSGMGNQAVQRLLREGVIRAQLAVNQPGDRFEIEADRMADKVMRMSDNAVTALSLPARNGKGSFQGSGSISPIVQRLGSDCSAEEVNYSAGPGHNSFPNIPREVSSLQDGGQPLGNSERAFFEPRFGQDLSKVRIHSGSHAADAARAINARAFTVGRNVVFGAGQYRPQAFGGRRLLAHELTHVLQQSGGSDGMLQSPAAIQRRLGDGHDLQSPWLAGDLRLEDIFDNDVTRFLRQGSRNISVKRVQQLLFFLGFDIGPKGADGIFGPDTDAAVRAFQTRFAPPVDGIIGPITIGALDQQANQPESNRTAPGATPAGPPVGTPPSISVDRIDIVDSPAGAIGGYPAILGNADLNVPGPFNDPTEVKNVHQIHFHLDNGNSVDLTPVREIQRTSTLAAGVPSNNPPDEVLPPGVAGPTRPGGFTGVLIARDGPPAHEIQRPSADRIVIADAPGFRGLAAASFPVTFRAHFILTVNDTRNAPIARINYDVLIDRRTQAEIPNTENRIVATARRDFVRGKNL